MGQHIQSTLAPQQSFESKVFAPPFAATASTRALAPSIAKRSAKNPTEIRQQKHKKLYEQQSKVSQKDPQKMLSPTTTSEIKNM